MTWFVVWGVLLTLGAIVAGTLLYFMDKELR